MLYDPKWAVQTKPDVFSLESLIAWLETQPADKAYNFFGNRSCVLAQYFRAHGYASIWIGGDRYKYEGVTRPLSNAFRKVAHPEGTWRFWRGTFGGALERARHQLAVA